MRSRAIQRLDCRIEDQRRTRAEPPGWTHGRSHPPWVRRGSVPEDSGTTK